MPPRTRKPAARKLSQPKPPALPPGVIQLDTPDSQAKIDAMVADREPLFAIGDKVYTIPKEVPPAWMFNALARAHKFGYDSALSYIVAIMLEDDGYEALANCATLTREHLETILDAMVKRVLPGGIPVPKGFGMNGADGSTSTPGTDNT